MYNSTIKQKRGICNGCNKDSFIKAKGKCETCYWSSLNKKSLEKKKEKYGKVDTSGNSELNRWFLERRKEMTGFCHHCGNKSTKHNDTYFKFSICHILPKRLFKSVATHESNFIELCFWGNNCHGNMDNNMLDLIDLNCFDEVVEKFLKMYPSIDKKERRYIPDVLLQYVKDNL